MVPLFKIKASHLSKVRGQMHSLSSTDHHKIRYHLCSVDIYSPHWYRLNLKKIKVGKGYSVLWSGKRIKIVY